MEMMDDAKLHLLKKVVIFNSLSDDSLARLAEVFEEQKYPAGSYIFKEGFAGESFMLVKTGTVEIIKHGSSADTDIHLADRGPGEILGEMALIEDSPRFADARAREDVSVLALSKDQFKRLLAENPVVAIEIMGSLSAKLRQADLQMISDLERKNAELESANDNLTKAKNFRDKIIDNAPFFMVITDNSGHIVLINESAEKIFGRPFREVDGKPIGEMILAIKEQDIFSEINQFLSNSGVWRGHLITGRADGSQIIIDLTVVKVGENGAESENPSVLYMGNDITEEKHMQRQAFQLERMATRGEMAAEIAHELNNYLSIVSGNLELLGMDIGRGKYDRVGKKTSAMKNGLVRITKFVEGLMSVARPETKMEIFDIHQFIDNELFFLKPQPKFRGIDFISCWGNDVPVIEADRGQLQQVLFNLLNNAADALAEIPPGKRKVTISTGYFSSEDIVKLTISDNGCGMSDEDYGRVFRQHFTTKKTGHGFGLLAVKRAIKSHGGRISAAPGPDGGASFTIELPRRLKVRVEKAAKAAV
jgi:PAS domain S-box-containing protein